MARLLVWAACTLVAALCPEWPDVCDGNRYVEHVTVLAADRQ